MRTSQLPLLLALPFASLAACNWNEVETGRLGRIELTPSNCGQPGCDLDEGIAVGGGLDLSLEAKDGRDVSDLRLVSSAPWVVEVRSAGLSGLEPTFRLLGTGAGLADLIVIDRYGYEVDYLPVEVATIADFDVTVVADGMVESLSSGTRTFEVNAGTAMTVKVDGTSRGRVLMGDVQLRTELDAAIATSLAPSSDPARGELAFTAPLGTHDVAFTAPGGSRLQLRIVGKSIVTPTR